LYLNKNKKKYRVFQAAFTFLHQGQNRRKIQKNTKRK